MTKDNINNMYFDWMYNLVFKNYIKNNVSYRKLLYSLHNKDFDYIIRLDANRADDGIQLRYRFGYFANINSNNIKNALDDKPCSILEMMVALAYRCEETIMGDPDAGDRTGEWFHDMLVSLGLINMYDSNFDRDYVEDTINKFIKRKYKPNGEGGLFTISSRTIDLRKVEIWYQMMWYLDEVIKPIH